MFSLLPIKKEITRLITLTMQSIECIPAKHKEKETNNINNLISNYMSCTNESELKEVKLLIKNKYDLIKEMYQLYENEDIKKHEEQQQKLNWKEQLELYKEEDRKCIELEKSIGDRARALTEEVDEYFKDIKPDSCIQSTPTPTVKMDSKVGNIRFEIEHSQDVPNNKTINIIPDRELYLDFSGIPRFTNEVESFVVDKDGNLIKKKLENRAKAPFINWYGCNPDPECLERHHQLLERQYFRGPKWEGVDITLPWEKPINELELGPEMSEQEKISFDKNRKKNTFKKLIR